MDNFNQYCDDKVPQFLSKSVTKRKTKLSVCDFIFQKNLKLTLLNSRKRSLSNLPITSISSRKSPQQLKSPSKIKIIKQKQKQIVLNQICTEQEQLAKQQMQQMNTYIKYQSQQKLPAVVKFNVQLDYDQSTQQKLIRIKKQIPKARLTKMYGHYRQISEKNQIIRIKKQDKQQNKQQLNTIIKQQTQSNNNKLQNQRCYFIKNVMLNTNNNPSQVQSKQKAHMHLLINKLKQTERRGKFGVNLIQRKHFQQISPIQLRTNKIHYQQIQRNNLKQEIMKKFTKQFNKKQKLKKQLKINNLKGQDFGGWNVIAHENVIEQYNQQF